MLCQLTVESLQEYECAEKRLDARYLESMSRVQVGDLGSEKSSIEAANVRGNIPDSRFDSTGSRALLVRHVTWHCEHHCTPTAPTKHRVIRFLSRDEPSGLPSTV